MKSILIVFIIFAFAHADCGDADESVECSFDEDCPIYPCVLILCIEGTDCPQPPCYINRCIRHKCVSLEKVASDQCKLSGCAGDWCVGKNDTEDYPCAEEDPETLCYQQYGTCDSNGCECDWIPTPSLSRCLWQAWNNFTQT